MNTLFFDAVEHERRKVLQMPKSREMRARERKRFADWFALWFGASYIGLICAWIWYLSVRGGR